MPDIFNISKVDIVTDSIPVDVCQRIKSKLWKINSRDSKVEFNIWDHVEGDEDFAVLRSKFLECANLLVRENSNTVDQLSLGRGWPVGYKDWEYQAPHHHGGTFVVGVAYIDVSEDSGDLLIQDPLAAFDWFDREDKRMSGNCRVSVPVTPETGMVIVMPGYLVHSTEPKPVGKTRLVLATNFEK